MPRRSRAPRARRNCSSSSFGAPIFRSRIRRVAASSCDEQVGRFCYWYDEKEPPAPREPDRIRDARTRLIALLDSAAAADPANLWVASQRVRYLAEAGRSKDAIAAALACQDDGDLAVRDARWVRVSRGGRLRAGGQRIPGGARRHAGARALRSGRTFRCCSTRSCCRDIARSSAGTRRGSRSSVVCGGWRARCSRRRRTMRGRSIMRA